MQQQIIKLVRWQLTEQLCRGLFEFLGINKWFHLCINSQENTIIKNLIYYLKRLSDSAIDVILWLVFTNHHYAWGYVTRSGCSWANTSRNKSSDLPLPLLYFSTKGCVLVWCTWIARYWSAHMQASNKTIKKEKVNQIENE